MSALATIAAAVGHADAGAAPRKRMCGAHPGLNHTARGPRMPTETTWCTMSTAVNLKKQAWYTCSAIMSEMATVEAGPPTARVGSFSV